MPFSSSLVSAAHLLLLPLLSSPSCPTLAALRLFIRFFFSCQAAALPPSPTAQPANLLSCRCHCHSAAFAIPAAMLFLLLSLPSKKTTGESPLIRPNVATPGKATQYNVSRLILLASLGSRENKVRRGIKAETAICFEPIQPRLTPLRPVFYQSQPCLFTTTSQSSFFARPVWWLLLGLCGNDCRVIETELMEACSWLA